MMEKQFDFDKAMKKPTGLQTKEELIAEMKEKFSQVQTREEILAVVKEYLPNTRT